MKYTKEEQDEIEEIINRKKIFASLNKKELSQHDIDIIKYEACKEYDDKKDSNLLEKLKQEKAEAEYEKKQTKFYKPKNRCKRKVKPRKNKKKQFGKNKK